MLKTITMSEENNNVCAEVMPGGPLKVEADIKVKTKSGEEIIRQGPVFFCRCGASSSKPFCDGSHRKTEFDKE